MGATNRTEPPTPRRLREARRKGQVAVSRDLAAASAMACGLIALALSVSDASAVLANEAGRWMAMAIETRELTVSSAGAELSAAARLAASFVLPCGIAACVGGLAAGFLQTGWLLSAAPISPKGERLNPATGLKRLAGLRPLVETCKTWVKLAALVTVIATLGGTILSSLGRLARNPGTPPLPVAAGLAWSLSLRALAATIVIGAADVLLQRFLHARDLRMSKDEIRRDLKEDEGDPLVKHARRQAHREIALQRMISAAGSASFVAVNPTHLAVAVRYDASADDAPRVVSKGAGDVARRIRRTAVQGGVRIVYDKPLARSLFRVPMDGEIPEELYAVVAEVLARISQEADARVLGPIRHCDIDNEPSQARSARDLPA